MGLLDIDPPGAPEKPRETPEKPGNAYTITVISTWTNSDMDATIRCWTDVFHGVDIDEVADEAIDTIVALQQRDDGYECQDAFVASMIAGWHRNLSLDLSEAGVGDEDDTVEEEEPPAEDGA